MKIAMKISNLRAAVAGTALVVGAALAQSPSPSLSHTDTAFLKQAAQGGLAEIEASQLAETNATDPQVKSFAEQMVSDHTRTGDELKALASSKGVEVPSDPSVGQRTQLKILGALKDGHFDQHYASEYGVDAHEKTVKLFQKEAAQGKDPEVKAFATRTLPALQHHLAMAQDLKRITRASSSD
jgi:putative membrane protein